MFYPFSNFDYLCYTSPWSAIDTYVSDSEGGYFYDLLLWLIYEESGNGWIDEDGTYHLNQELIDLYDDQTAVTNGYIPQNWVDYLKLVYSINYPFTGLDQSGEVDLSKGIYMELPLNDLQKSNMHWAYEKSKHLF
jgi:hypothetical protein